MVSRSDIEDKKPLKQKLTSYYEEILKGDDPSGKKLEFWDEFFLLKANVEFISKTVNEMSPSALLAIKGSLNSLFIQCCRVLQSDDNMIRNINALQTLCVLVQSIYHKHSSSDASFEIVDIVVGIDAAECQMRNLIESLRKFLSEDYPVSVKNLSLKLILIILTAMDNISQNVILEYFMMNSVFEALLEILSHPDAREQHGYDAAVVLALLVNYRKHEAANIYVIKLSVLDNEIALNGLGCVVSSIFTEYIKQYAQPVEEPKGILQAVTSWVGGILAPPEVTLTKVRVSEAALLVLYEAVHLNKHFHTILTHTRSISTPTTPTTPTPAVDRNLPVPGSPSIANERVVMATQAMNLLGTLLSFSSIVLQNIKDTKSSSNARLCLIVLTCIVEEQHTASFLHDPNMTFRIDIHRADLLHRRIKKDKQLYNLPLACSLLELLVEFIVSHLSKHFHVDLYRKCLGVIHRILCYQKRRKVRLEYSWKELWNALISLLRFLVSSGEQLLPQTNVFVPANDVIRLFNLFITYGDTFLPSPTAYDELYYELIRVRQLFDGLYQLALKHCSTGQPHSEEANKLTLALFNIRSIATHFVPKIDSFTETNRMTLTPNQVLEVIRSNYDTLTLKLQDGLDQHEKYTEKPKETTFFTQLVRGVTNEVRQSLYVSNLQQMTVLTELSGVP